MIMNLFSIFDPSTAYASLSWVILLVPTLILYNKMTLPPVRKFVALSLPFKSIIKEVKQLTKDRQTKNLIGTVATLFAIVILINIIAIFPFNYTTTAHISITFSLRLILWIATIVNALKNSFNRTIIHLTPIGTPNPLINFMVIIESISQIIRPITLAVRLIANIVAGHLLLNLLRNFSLKGILIITGSSIPLLVLVILEIGVALIQAYVITVLSTLYYRETF